MRKLAEFSEPNKEILSGYFKHMRLIGKKERTIYGESWNLKPFFDFLQGRPVREVERGDVEEYIIKRKEKVSPTTVHNGIVSLRSFFNWLNPGNDFFTGVKSKKPKNNLPVDELLLSHDVIVLRDAANNQRDRALVMVLWDSAARKGELLNINIGHIQLDKYGAAVIVDGKTGKRRIRLIDSVPDLQLWLNMHPLRDDPNAPVFITDRKYDGNYRRLNEQTVNNMLNGLAEKARIKKNVYPHAFRHGRLTDLAKRGFNEMELRIFAGWTKESNMPATYLHLSGADIEKKLLAKNGIIEDDSKEREEELKPVECPRCKTKNPVGAKYCHLCSMILDHKLAGKMDNDFQNASKLIIDFDDPAVKAQLLKFLSEK
jgi:Site-specific recombinase XerD